MTTFHIQLQSGGFFFCRIDFDSEIMSHQALGTFGRPRAWRVRLKLRLVRLNSDCSSRSLSLHPHAVSHPRWVRSRALSRAPFNFQLFPSVWISEKHFHSWPRRNTWSTSADFPTSGPTVRLRVYNKSQFLWLYSTLVNQMCGCKKNGCLNAQAVTKEPALWPERNWNTGGKRFHRNWMFTTKRFQRAGAGNLRLITARTGLI